MGWQLCTLWNWLAIARPLTGRLRIWCRKPMPPPVSGTWFNVSRFGDGGMGCAVHVLLLTFGCWYATENQ